jgi:hypothetical protein
MKEKAKADDGEMTIPDLCKSDKFAGCAPLVCTPLTGGKKFSCGEKRTGCSFTDDQEWRSKGLSNSLRRRYT